MTLPGEVPVGAYRTLMQQRRDERHDGRDVDDQTERAKMLDDPPLDPKKGHATRGAEGGAVKGIALETTDEGESQ